jgi:acyl-CoA synthetase (AMP-forming)/AMP-acid ligase II
VRADPATAAEAEDPRADLRFGTVPRLLADVAARRPDAEAVVDGDRRLTFGQLHRAAGEVSRGLIASGLARGDRVAMWAPNSAEWIIAALGALGAGGILVTLNTRYKGAEAAYLLQASGATTLFSVGNFLGTDYPGQLEGHDTAAVADLVVLGEAPSKGGPAGVVTRSLDQLVAAGEGVEDAVLAERQAAVHPGDLSDVMFTSGTTGRPKGVPMTHAQSLRTFGTWSSVVGLRAEDRYLVINPFFHTFGYKAGILACLLAGATLLPMATLDVDAVFEVVEREAVTVLPGPPTLYQSLLGRRGPKDAGLSSLRLGVTGAAVVPVDLVVAMKEELGFETVLTAYGLSESCGTVTMCRRSDPPEVVANTSGRAIPGLEVVTVAEGAPVVGAPGEVLVRGYTVMTGYWHDEASTEEAIDGEGWLHTGDVGVMDEAGNLTITDRLKDMFVVGGFNAYPAEIEQVLLSSPQVAQVAVVGVPDQRLGEVGCAFVVPRGTPEGDLAGGLIAFARGQMANFKVPRHVEVVDELPMNASGKVLKTELRRRFHHAAAHDKEDQQP